MSKIELGDEVKHTYTGFQGVAVARKSYLSGCDRITILPKVDKKTGKLGDALDFDEPECVVVKKGKKPKLSQGETGGFKPEARHAARN